MADWSAFPKINITNCQTFKYFDLERTWWRSFQKRVVRTKFDIYVFISRTNDYLTSICRTIECRTNDYLTSICRTIECRTCDCRTNDYLTSICRTIECRTCDCRTNDCRTTYVILHDEVCSIQLYIIMSVTWDMVVVFTVYSRVSFTVGLMTLGVITIVMAMTYDMVVVFSM
jgi:hypothetical protein